jgi:hypothetical protein
MMCMRGGKSDAVLFDLDGVLVAHAPPSAGADTVIDTPARLPNAIGDILQA